MAPATSNNKEDTASNSRNESSNRNHRRDHKNERYMRAWYSKLPVPEVIEPVFAKTCSFTITENESFGLVFAKTGSINSGTG
jgi:hypothetical protein